MDQYNKENKTDSITGRFFNIKPMEELYDTTKDPDNVNNLINEPEYKVMIQTMRKQMTQWQIRHFDAGMLPESEIVEAAASAGKTIYDFVRDKKLYNLKAYLEVSEQALMQDPAKTHYFYEMLDSSDPGIRYWATIGLFNLQDKIQLNKQRILLY